MLLRRLDRRKWRRTYQ